MLSASRASVSRRRAIDTATRPIVDRLESRTHLTAVSAHSPYNGQQQVSVSANITVTFDVAMNSSTLNSSTLQLRDASNNAVAAAYSYNSGSRTLTIDPTANLASGNNYYYVKVVSGASGVKDSNGVAMTADYNFSFTPGTPSFGTTTIFSGLNYPTAIEFAPDGRIFVAEKRGIIKVFDNINDTTADTFVDLRTQVHNYWDRGLLGLALHPNFPSTPYVYALYTYDAPIGGTAPAWGTVNGDSDNGPGTTGTGPLVSGRLSRFTASGNAASGGETVLINDWVQQYPSHSIGHLQFGPDGYLYASAGDGASFSGIDYGQNNLAGDPTNEGGAVRSQDILSSGDPTGLDGTIIRIDPLTGAGAPGNPFASSPDANNKRVVAWGLRNPFRFNFRPGTNEIWAADVGYLDWEEINRITNTTDTTAENFGWPAYEGAGRQPGYDAANLPLLENLYTANNDTKPYYTYSHGQQVVSGSAEPTGGSSVTGVAFYNGGSYPSAYDGAMFFADYSRKFIYIMYKGPNGLPDVSTRQVFRQLTTGATELQVGPNGDLFWVNYDGGSIIRFTYNGNNTPPTAVITPSTTTGNTPLLVNFSGASSTDPDPGETLTYSWDLNGDGTFGDSTSITPSFTYTNPGAYNVRLRVTDRTGATNTATVVIDAGQAPNVAPTPVMNTPLASLNWKVGDTVSFSGTATDPEDGSLPAGAIEWELAMIHANLIDPNNIHTHVIQSWTGISSGSFVAPDHEYPSYLELRMKATDSDGATTTITRRLDPQTVNINISSNIAAQVSFNGEVFNTPFTHPVIAGSTTSISAVTPMLIGGTNYHFNSWSDGGDRSHEIVAGTSNINLTATYGTQAPFLITPFQVGQRIEAEYYDLGDDGQAYHDLTSGNAGNSYRLPTNVDMEGTGDINGNYNVGWSESGEWLEYTIDVATAGSYVLDIRVACPADGGKFHVDFGGVNKTGSVDVPNTGGWQDYVTLSRTVVLSAGVQVMRLSLDTNSYIGSVGNFNWMQLRGYTTLSAPSGLTAASISSSQIRLNWIDNSSDETGFKIERKTGSAGAWQQITQTAANITTFLDTALAANQTYYYRVRGTDGTNNGGYSGEANASTSSLQSPYQGSPFSTGQTIEAEDYDIGGPGVAYFDQVVGNAGSQYRSDDVDIEGTSDTGGGYNLGWAEAGEWLEYTVNVPAAGTYQFEARVASQGVGGAIHVEFDGIDKTGPLAVPTTGGWQSWQTVTRLVTLSAGVQTMRVSLDANSNWGSVGNFNWFKLIPTVVVGGDGLSATYYNNLDFTGTQVSRIDPRVDFNWGLGTPDQNIAPNTYSARWQGQVLADYTQTYTFHTRTDDGVRLWVNDQLIIDKWIDGATTEYSGTIALVAGQKYNIRMDYYQNGGGATARLLWSSPSVIKAVIPQANLFSTQPAAQAAPALFTSQSLIGPTTAGGAEEGPLDTAL